MTKTCESLTYLVRDELVRCMSPYGSISDAFATCEAPQVFARTWFVKNYHAKLAIPDAAETSKRESAALAKWLSAEHLCYNTNVRLGNLSDFSPHARFLEHAAALIRGVIGDSPPGRLVGDGRWSNGATCMTRRGTHHSLKQTGPIATTAKAARHVPFFFAGLATDFEVVDHCRAVFVPKTSDIDRVIACEPAANAFMQQSVHAFFRRRLKKFGVADLDDQSYNQEGAFLALADGLATIDLSSASDTVSIELVRWLLPPDWFEFLSDLRSPRMLLNGRMFLLEKFSSMGNAFTFELETLIFWAICKTIDQEFDPRVYGDDLVVRQSHAHSIINALSFCGFLINHEKSYTSGRFFESCGKHFYDLEDVTPCYQKELITSVQSAMRAHNRLIRWGMRCKQLSRVQSACKLLRSAYPEFRACIVPYGCERDDGWLSPHKLFKRRTKGGDFKTNVIRSRVKFSYDVNESCALAYKLYAPKTSAEHPRGYSATASSFETLEIGDALIWYASCI